MAPTCRCPIKYVLVADNGEFQVYQHGRVLCVFRGDVELISACMGAGGDAYTSYLPPLPPGGGQGHTKFSPESLISLAEKAWRSYENSQKQINPPCG